MDMLLGELLDVGEAQSRALELVGFIQTYVTSLDFLGQIAVIAAAFCFVWLAGRRLAKLAGTLIPGSLDGRGGRRLRAVLGVFCQSGLWLALVWIALTVAIAQELPFGVLRIAVSLLTAWVAIRAMSLVVRDKLISNALFYVAWGIAALNIVGLLNPILSEINQFSFALGDQQITGLKILNGLISLGLLIWAATALSSFLEHRIRNISRLTPTLQILLSKALQVTLVALAVIFALQIVGIPLTVFAIFGGALGLGLGLGLQRAASNIISGLMLLMDKSIKPGDVITIGDTFGWVTSLGGRYVAVRTRDGTEHLIPNEVFISNGLENWSYSERAVRLKLPIGISYGSDPHQAIEICLAAAREHDRVVEKPEPTCPLKGFGDSSVDLELRIWITDPQNGVSNVKSDIFLKIWDGFQAAGIEIPFPQRDVSLKGPVEVLQSRDRAEV